MERPGKVIGTGVYDMVNNHTHARMHTHTQ